MEQAGSRWLWITGAASVALFVGLAWYLAPLEPSVLALQLTFRPRVFGDIVHFWSPEQLARFRMHLLWDCVLLASYGAFGWLLARRTRVFAAYRPKARAAVAWMLPAAAAFDAAENALHGWLTEAPRFGTVWPYVAAGGCATLKWGLIVAFAAVTAHALSRDEAME
jgi:hypothetical protein